MKITAVWFDLRAAWRGVRGGGWASLTAIVALALGIGGAITAAAVAYAGLLRPLPFPQPNELVTVRKASESGPAGGWRAVLDRRC